MSGHRLLCFCVEFYNGRSWLRVTSCQPDCVGFFLSSIYVPYLVLRPGHQLFSSGNSTEFLEEQNRHRYSNLFFHQRPPYDYFDQFYLGTVNVGTPRKANTLFGVIYNDCEYPFIFVYFQPNSFISPWIRARPTCGLLPMNVRSLSVLYIHQVIGPSLSSNQVLREHSRKFHKDSTCTTVLDQSVVTMLATLSILQVGFASYVTVVTQQSVSTFTAQNLFRSSSTRSQSARSEVWRCHCYCQCLWLPTDWWGIWSWMALTCCGRCGFS